MPPAALARVIRLAGKAAPWLTATVIAGLLVFGAVLAINSALHSHLILASNRTERVAMDVGFYDKANAAGRLLGRLNPGTS